MHETVILGAYSWTFRGSSIRMLDQDQVIDVGFGEQTPPEVARDYLEVKYEGVLPLRAGGAQAEFFHRPRGQAMYALPSKLGKASYIDISAAYLSILDVVGWDVDYSPGQFLLAGTPPSDFLARDDKVARNCLVSSGLPSRLTLWTGDQYLIKQSWNRLYNMGLWALVQDVLHAVALELYHHAGAVYFNTDGAIVPYHMLDKAEQIIRSWGLSSKLKAQGATQIFSVGRYRCGAKKTARQEVFGDGSWWSVNQFVDPVWLKSEFSHLSHIQNS